MSFTTKPVTFYKTTDVDMCPESAGIYAWYLFRELSKADGNNIVLTLNEMMKSHSEHRIELESNLIFNHKWNALVTKKTVETDKISKVWESNEVSVFVDFFNSSFCQFFSPIYIGKGDNLRTRISSHIRTLKDLTRNSDVISSEFVEDIEFARRAHKNGVKESDLVFTYLEVNTFGNELSNLEVRDSIESWLNMIVQPVFGRR